MADPATAPVLLPTLALGASLGLASGISPGPLSALVLSSTLEGGLRAGTRIAVAPLLTDLLMLATASAALARLGSRALAVVGVAGGVVVLLLGLSTLRQASRPLPASGAEASGRPWKDLVKGAAVNLLNPHAWLFWMVVGGPMIAAAWASSPRQALAFLAVFETCLVGSKVGLAVLVAHNRRRLQGAGYRWTLRTLGVILLAFGVRLIVQGGVHG